eukprot:115801_1
MQRFSNGFVMKGTWENSHNMGVQSAPDGNFTLTDTYPSALTTVSDNDGVSKGVFTCDNQASGTYYNTPNTALYNLGELSFNAYALEVIVRPTQNNVTFFGYIIGIEGTRNDIQGNSISYNRISGDNSSEHVANKFFPSNIERKGWKATDLYWDTVSNTKVTNITLFYHVIVTQSSTGMVTVFVNGVQYGTSYLADDRMRLNTTTYHSWYIKICGDGTKYTGFDGHIRGFAFHTESFTSVDALSACYVAKQTTNMVYCDTPYPTSSPSTLPPTMDLTNVITIRGMHDDWIVKEGENCGDGYTDLDASDVYYGNYCHKCPEGTAGTYGVCEECDTLQEPNHSRTDCEYYQPVWLWLTETLGAVIFVCSISTVVHRIFKKKYRSSRNVGDSDTDDE